MNEPTSNVINNYNRFQVGLGLMIVIALIIPTNLVIHKLIGGMYGSVFKGQSPAFFHLINVLIDFGIGAGLAWIAIIKLNIWNRLEPNYASPTLFSIGTSIIILFLVIRIFASTIQGGGPAYAVSIIGAYPLMLAKLLLYIAVFRVMLGIKPMDKSSPIKDNATKHSILNNRNIKIQIFLGFALVLMSILPIYTTIDLPRKLLHIVIDKTNQTLYFNTIRLLSFGISIYLAWLLINKYKFIERLNSSYVYTKTLTVVNAVLLFFMMYGFFRTTLNGSALSLLISSGHPYLYLTANYILYVLMILILIGIKPKKASETTQGVKKEKGIQEARKVLNNPVTLSGYMRLTGKSSDEVTNEIAKGSLKGFEYDGMLYIESNNINTGKSS